MKKFLFWSIFVIIVVLGLVFYWKFSFTYSEGYRAGLLQKFSYKGNIFKTYEGELILSSVESNKNVALASEKFYFSVTEKRVADQLNNFQGRFVIVHYLEKKGALIWRGDTPYIVDSVMVTQ
jgi:hypothetical protein